MPYPELVRERFHAWLLAAGERGTRCSRPSSSPGSRIRDHVAASLGITVDDFGYTPFVEDGGLGKAEVFGDDLGPLLDELNEVLVA